MTLPCSWLPALLLCAAGVGASAEPLAGRWEGAARVPSRDIPLVIDIAPDDAGQWRGSATVPGFGVKGAPLTGIKVTAGTLAFAINGAMGQPEITAHLSGDGTLEGEFRQGGNTAPLSLHKAGDAQVELPRTSTAVRKELEGSWVGEYELSGYKRQVLLDLANQPGKPAEARLTIIGKRENKVPVSLLIDEGAFLSLSSQEFQLSFELRYNPASNELTGDFAQGPFEAPVTLHRPAKTGGTSK